MCEWHGGTYKGNLRVELARPRRDGIDFAHVDACIQPLVQAINDGGIQTTNSCCGHGQRPGWIALEDGRHIFIARDHYEMVGMSAGWPVLTMPSVESDDD